MQLPKKPAGSRAYACAPPHPDSLRGTGSLVKGSKSVAVG